MPIFCSGVIDILNWLPPEKNCGACGVPSCAEFVKLRTIGKKKNEDCPFFARIENKVKSYDSGALYRDKDILGNDYDFILHPLPGEPSARKIILPFRPDIVEKWEIEKDDIVLGRPMGAGCPVQHVLSVIHADPVTGILTCHVISPLIARDNSKNVKDIRAYHITGFEGFTEVRRESPVFGKRHRFLPGFCMMNLAHTGVVNMVLVKETGMQVRVEDIRIF